MLPTWQGLNLQPLDHQSDEHPTEPPRLALYIMIEIPVFNVNSVDPDQMLLSVAFCGI